MSAFQSSDWKKAAIELQFCVNGFEFLSDKRIQTGRHNIFRRFFILESHTEFRMDSSWHETRAGNPAYSGVLGEQAGVGLLAT